MSDIFDDGNKAEFVSNFFRFDKVGDKVSGVLMDVVDKEASGAFKAQKIYTLKQEDGTDVKVSISVTKQGTIDMLKSAAIGQLVGIKFAKEIKASQPGFKPTKALDVFLGETPKLEKAKAANNDLDF